MAKVLIEYEGNLGNLKAQLAEVEQANQSISDSAKQTAQQVGDEYRKVASTAAKAFAGQEVSKALQDQEKNVDALTQSLTDLYNEEVKLLQGNKQLTDEFKKNRATFEQTRKEFDAIKGTAKALSVEIPKTAAEIGKLEDRLRELAIAGQQGTQEFDDIARAIGEYKAAITTADRAVDLYAKSTDAATGRLGELEDKLYDLALAGQTNTQEFKDTITQVTNLKRAVFEVDQQVDSYVERSRGFATVVQNVELIGNAFQLVEGAAALFGEENEELQKTLVRLNAILAITQGLEQARTILLEQSAKQTGLVAIATKAWNFVVGASVGGFKALRIAIAATGFGALVVALGLIITNFDKIRDAAFKLQPGLRKVAEGIGFLIDKTKELLGITEELNQDSLDKALKAQDQLLKAQVNAVNRQIALQQKLGNDTTQLEIKREQLQLSLAERRLAFLEKNSQLRLANEELFNEKVFELEQEVLNRRNAIAVLQIQTEEKVTDALFEELRKRSFERLKLDDDYFSEAKKRERQEAKTSLEFRKFINESLSELDLTTDEERFNRRANFLKAEIAEGDRSLSTRIELIKTEGEAEKAAIRDRLGFTRDAENQIRIIEAETQDKIKALRDGNLDDLEKNIIKYVNAIGSAFSAIVDLQNELSERRIEQIETLRDKELAANEVLQQSYAQRVRNDEAITLRANRKIVEEKRKQARLDKAQGIFEAVVNTAVAVTSALKEKFPLSIILAAAAGIAGATQIAKISSEPLPSFGKGGWIDGEPHARGGVDINAEGGEFVTRKSQAGTFRRELEAMNTSRAAFLKVIEESYVRPRLAQLSNDRSVNVNVNARLNSSGMESRLDTLTKETRKTRRVFTQAMAQSHSQRYSW